MDNNLLVRLNLGAHDILSAIVKKRLNLLRAHTERVAHLESGRGIVLEILYLITLSLKFLSSIESYVRMPRLKKLVNILLINLATLRLTVRTMAASIRDTLVELDAQPLKRLNDILLSTRDKASRVSILDTEDKLTAVLLSEQIIIETSADTADMKRSGR